MHILSTYLHEGLAAGKHRLAGRHLLRVADLAPGELEAVVDLAMLLKDLQAAREPHATLQGRTVGLLFARPSTRTRVSFAVGVAQLGATAVTLDADSLQLARGESPRDTALVLSRYLDALVVRMPSQASLEELARNAAIPVVNALTDAEHPCQALADVLTIRERLGGTDGVRLAYVGDGNNVLVSLAAIAPAFGISVVAAVPRGYEPDHAALAAAGCRLDLVHDPREAARGADVLYTDVWASMGQEDEREQRLRAFAPFALDRELVALAADDALVLHCLPAHPGEEIAAEVLYGPQSGVWDQAENRLHAQKALLASIVP